MTQPDPDPTNREPAWEALANAIMFVVRNGETEAAADKVQSTLSDLGYQIVPKVEQGVDYSDQARSDADQGVSSRIVDVLRQAYFDWGNDPPQILTALNASGYQIVPKVELEQVVPTPSWRQLMARNDQLRRELAAMKVELEGLRALKWTELPLESGNDGTPLVFCVTTAATLAALQALDKENG